MSNVRSWSFTILAALLLLAGCAEQEKQTVVLADNHGQKIWLTPGAIFQVDYEVTGISRDERTITIHVASTCEKIVAQMWPDGTNSTVEEALADCRQLRWELGELAPKRKGRYNGNP
jgi:hypothetical protein